MPNGNDRVTLAPEQPVETDKKVEDPELVKLLNAGGRVADGLGGSRVWGAQGFRGWGGVPSGVFRGGVRAWFAGLGVGRVRPTVLNRPTCNPTTPGASNPQASRSTRRRRRQPPPRPRATPRRPRTASEALFPPAPAGAAAPRPRRGAPAVLHWGGRRPAAHACVNGRALEKVLPDGRDCL
jgi:hypothetical protein